MSSTLKFLKTIKNISLKQLLQCVKCAFSATRCRRHLLNARLSETNSVSTFTNYFVKCDSVFNCDETFKVQIVLKKDVWNERREWLARCKCQLQMDKKREREERKTQIKTDEPWYCSYVSSSRGCGFTSQYRILDIHFFTLFWCNNCSFCLKSKKKPRMVNILKDGTEENTYKKDSDESNQEK